MKIIALVLTTLLLSACPSQPKTREQQVLDLTETIVQSQLAQELRTAREEIYTMNQLVEAMVVVTQQQNQKFDTLQSNFNALNRKHTKLLSENDFLQRKHTTLLYKLNPKNKPKSPILNDKINPQSTQ